MEAAHCIAPIRMGSVGLCKCAHHQAVCRAALRTVPRTYQVLSKATTVTLKRCCMLQQLPGFVNGRLTYGLVPGPSRLVYTIILNPEFRTSSFLPPASPPPPPEPDHPLLSAPASQRQGQRARAMPDSNGDGSGSRELFMKARLPYFCGAPL